MRFVHAKQQLLSPEPQQPHLLFCDECLLIPTFLLRSSESRTTEIDWARLQRALPLGFSLSVQASGVVLRMPSQYQSGLSPEGHVARELDRLFFLTAVRLYADRIDGPVAASLDVRYDIYAPLPEDIAPQEWSTELALQLRLWTLAADEGDPFAKVLLLYQIVELLPKAKAKELDPDGDCRNLRHLVAHSDIAKKKYLKAYCKRHALPLRMGDRNSSELIAHVEAQMPMLRRTAKNAIELQAQEASDSPARGNGG